MALMRPRAMLVAPLFALLALQARAAETPGFSDLYSEIGGGSRADTVTGTAVLRSGRRWLKGRIESYATLRLAADSRTQIDANEVAADNFGFLGAGVDVTGLVDGLRLTLQVGGALDLSSKIHREGFELRTGFIAYREWEALQFLRAEFYSEALYVQRYRNFLPTAELHLLTDSGAAFSLSPLFGGRVTADSRGLADNRIAEIQEGLRLRLRAPLALSLNAFFAQGRHWQSQSSAPGYRDFRLSLSSYLTF